MNAQELQQTLLHIRYGFIAGMGDPERASDLLQEGEAILLLSPAMFKVIEGDAVDTTFVGPVVCGMRVMLANVEQPQLAWRPYEEVGSLVAEASAGSRDYTYESKSELSVARRIRDWTGIWISALARWI